MKFFLDWIRHCPNCGTSLGSFHWLCTPCETILLRSAGIKYRMINGRIDHYYLWDWKRGDHLTPIVHSLKRGRHCRAIKDLVGLMRPPVSGVPLFYPVGRPRDHAWQMARAFCETYGGDLRGLVPEQAKKQAFLSKKDRQLRRFHPQILHLKRAYFVDDIVTTGGTLRAADRALGRPPKMTVWSLFYRNPL